MVQGIIGGRINKYFHALTHRNFRYFWLGQCVSLIGTWMQNVALSWLVLVATTSPFLLGILGTVQFLPVTIFSLFAGVIIDRYPKKKLLIFTQAASMLLAFLLAFLVFTQTYTYGAILVLAFLLGCINCIDMPTRQAFTLEVAGKEDLMNAVALNSAIFNLARILGPSIGAVVMAYTGPAWCFLINGVSYICVIYGLSRIDTKPQIWKKEEKNHVIQDIKEGITYTAKKPVLIQTLLMVLVMGILAFNYSVLVPSYTKMILHQGEKAYGFLMSCLGLGSLVGAIGVSIKSNRGPNRSLLLMSSLIVSTFLVLGGLNRYLLPAAGLLAVTGVFNVLFSTTANSMIQLNTEDAYRGRVMSLYTMAFVGGAPIGNLLIGWISDRYGVANAFLMSGILIFVFSGIINGLFAYHKNRNLH